MHRVVRALDDGGGGEAASTAGAAEPPRAAAAVAVATTAKAAAAIATAHDEATPGQGGRYRERAHGTMDEGGARGVPVGAADVR